MSSINQHKHILCSIIIPVYNTAQYVEETIKSICAQTLKDIEIIAINDGSTDNSLDIIKSLAEQDNRIKVYTQNNKGVASTRNFGISISKGDYIYFMDSDDLLDANALELCTNRCIQENLDFIIFNANIFSTNHSINKPVKSYNRDNCLNETSVYIGANALEYQIDKKCYTPSVWLNVIKKKYLDEIKLSFYDGIIHEDQLFTTQLYLNAQKVGYISSSFFKRRYRENSIMTTRFQWRNIQCYLLIVDQFKAIAKYKNTELINKYLSQMLDAAIWNSHALPLVQRLRLFILCTLGSYRNLVKTRTLLVLIFKKYIHNTKSNGKGD